MLIFFIHNASSRYSYRKAIYIISHSFKKQLCGQQVCAVFNCFFVALGESNFVGLSQILILF